MTESSSFSFKNKRTMAPSVDDTGEQQFGVDTLTPDERGQWKAYLKDLRKKYPNNSWRL
jgi:hypothetical protein